MDIPSKANKPSIFRFMRAAIDQAIYARNLDEVPIGAVIVHNETVISTGHNIVQRNCDPTAHAEIMAIRGACQVLNSHVLANCSIYTTIEPCYMCCTAISYSRIGSIYYGAKNHKFGALSNEVKLFDNQSLYKPEVSGGFCEEEIESMMAEFFRTKRSEF